MSPIQEEDVGRRLIREFVPSRYWVALNIGVSNIDLLTGDFRIMPRNTFTIHWNIRFPHYD